MDRKILENRTKQFHVNVIKLCKKLPKDAAGYETARQVIRSAGSVGANYRASKRAKSKTDFSYKISIVLEESDESLYWLEVVKDAELILAEDVNPLIQEANELTSIFTASDKTVRGKNT
jgi:four helix bundle protein